jgi:hypothetical protein
MDRIDQQAVLQASRHDGRTVIASPPNALPRIQRQAALDLLRILPVALVTLLREHRPDLLFEEIDLILRERLGGGRAGFLHLAHRKRGGAGTGDQRKDRKKCQGFHDKSD